MPASGLPCPFTSKRGLGNRPTAEARDQQSRKSLVAEIILMTPFDPSVSSMEVALAAWLRLRAGENAPDNGNGLDDAYLRRMADFTLSLL